MPLIFGVTSAGVMVPIRVDTNGLIETVNTGWFSGAWQKNPLLMGYSGSVRRVITNTALPAGASVQADSAVPAGEVWDIENIVVTYIGTVAGVTLTIGIRSGAGFYPLFEATGLTSGVYVDRQGRWTLGSGDNLEVSVTGATLNDDLLLRAVGYRFDTDQ